MLNFSIVSMRIVMILMIIGVVLIPRCAIAAPPSHCKPEEFSVVDSWMGKVYATSGGWRNIGDGKFLSLCADRKVEPFSRLVYRYGTLGQVELEVVATPTSKFYTANRSTSPHTGDDIVFFKKDGYTYYVAIATGQGSGVSLIVFKGRKKVSEHFSGNEQGEDFQLGPAEIDFVSPISDVLSAGQPEHDF